MRTFRLFAPLAIAAASAALLIQQTSQKKPLTLDDLLSQPRMQPITPDWAPDGRRFTYQERGAVRLYDIAAKSSREWFRPEALEKNAVTPIQPKEFGWQNRRVS